MRFPEISGWIFQNFKNYKKILSELRDPALGSWVPCQLRIQGVQKEQKITYPHVRRSKGTVDVANLSKIIPQVTPIGFLCLWVSLDFQKLVIYEPGPKPGPQVPVVGPGWVLQDGGALRIHRCCKHVPNHTPDTSNGFYTFRSISEHPEAWYFFSPDLEPGPQIPDLVPVRYCEIETFYRHP